MGRDIGRCTDLVLASTYKSCIKSPSFTITANNPNKATRLLANDGNQLLILILVSGEDDSCSCSITDLADVGSIPSNEETMVLRLGTDLGS